MMRIASVAAAVVSTVLLSTNLALGELSAIACSGEKANNCPFKGIDFFAPSANKKLAPPSTIAKNYCSEKWSKAGKQPGQAIGTVMAPAMPGNCCGYLLIRIDCQD